MHPFELRLLIALAFLAVGVIAILAQHRADKSRPTARPLDAEEQFFARRNRR
jgi:hypothetical protein